MKATQKSRLYRGVATLGAALIVPTAWAQAQTDARLTLEEIIVTATKREQKLQDVPLAISAVTSEDIVARGYTQFGDYLNSVPGVYFEDAGPGVSQVRIRGLSAVEGDMPSTVATYFGETLTSVQTLQGGKPNPRLVDIERVEVLRGPQGTLFGANALAGVVRIIPKTADTSEYQAHVGVRGFTTAHSDGESYHAEGMVNLALAPDRFAVRLVAYKDEIAGYVDNVFAGQPEFDYGALGEALLGLPPGSLPPGVLVSPEIAGFTRRDVNAEDTVGGRAAIAFQATDRLRFDFSYTKQEVTLDSEPHTTPAAGEYAQSRGLDAFKRAQFVEDLDIASMTARYDWENVSLTAASSRTQLQRSDARDVTGFTSNTFGAPLPWGVDTTGDGKLLTHEVRLQSNEAHRYTWLIGAFYLDQDSDWSQVIRDFTCPTCLPELVLGQDFALRGSGFIGEQQKAVFGEFTYDITPRWTIGVGARYLEADLNRRVDAAEGLLATGADEEDIRRSADEFNPAFHLRFRPFDELSLYLQAARGFRSSVPNLALPASCFPEADEVGVHPITDPDTLWNYELGAKSTLAGGRAQLNAAIYEAQWSGVQLPANLSCGFGAILNGGDATGRGVEVELNAQLSEAWRLNLSGAYNDTEFDSVLPQTGFSAGDRLPGSADRNFAAGLQYDFDFGAGWGGFARADYVYVGDVRLVFQSGTVTQDAFGTGNLRVGVRNDALAVELFGRNLADKRAVLSTGLPEEGGNQVLIRPRELGVELRYNFR